VLLFVKEQPILKKKPVNDSAIVTDQTFINNLTYFINMFSVYIDLTTVNIEGTSYVCNSYISLSGKKYYILGTQPMTQ
jgi:hypothetical protein